MCIRCLKRTRAVLDSSRKLENIMETLIKRFKVGVASKDVLKWQLPVTERLIKGLPDRVNPLAKAHFFVNYVSLCGKYFQYTDFYETDIECGEIARSPEIACKRCYKKWLKEYRKTS